MNRTESDLHIYETPHTYVERISVDIDDLTQELCREPERPLNPEEKEQLFAIDSAIVDGRYTTSFGEKLDIADQVEDWYSLDDDIQPVKFKIEYFLTPEGQAALTELEDAIVGVGSERVLAVEPPEAVNVERRLASVVIRAGKKDKKAVKNLAQDSHAYHVEQLKESMAQDGEIPEDPERVNLFFDAEGFLKKMHSVAKMRAFLREVWRDVKDRGDLPPGVRDALLVEVDAFRQKATEIMGTLYPLFVDIYRQVLLVDDPRYKHQIDYQMYAINRPLTKISEDILEDEQEEARRRPFFEEPSELLNRFLITMDRWRNGFVRGEDNTPFSDEVIELERSLADAETVEEGSAAFSPEELAYLDSLEWDAEKTADLARHILAQNDLLSQDGEDDFTDGKWPSDSSADHPKIGVVIGPFANLQYSQGWIKIPSKMSKNKRRLRQTVPSGPAYVLPHEFEHAIDGITSKYGERKVALARTKTRMSGGVREGVGKKAESDAAHRLFGETLPPSLAYVKSLRTLLECGRENAAIMVFAQEAAVQKGNSSVEAEISHAENRVQRLINYGGLNSQPLVYVEQVLLGEALNTVPERVREVVAANSFMDLRTQARLHQFGLLITDRYKPKVPAVEAVQGYLRGLLAER